MESRYLQFGGGVEYSIVSCVPGPELTLNWGDNEVDPCYAELGGRLVYGKLGD